VLGTLVLRGDSAPPNGARVTAEWSERSLRSTGVDARTRWLDAAVDARGTFRLCGVPRATPLVLRATAPDAGADPVALTIPPAERLARAQLVLDRRADRGATFRGLVLADSTLQPIADVEVTLPDLDRHTVTDARGAFRVSDVPAGTHRVIVRRLGYGPLDTRLAFAPNGVVDRRVFLAKVTTLDSVVVTERRTDLVDFDENRRVGLGRFLDRTQLEQLKIEPLAEVLRRMPGVQVVSGTGNKAWVATTRGVRTGFSGDECSRPRESESKLDPKPCPVCYANVYLDGMLLSRAEVPNVNRFTPDQLEGIEYYAGPSEIPARYSDMHGQCGVLVLHTRRP